MAASADPGMPPGPAPEVADPSGDANGINGQDVVPGLENGPSTSPASVSSADLTSADLATSYTTVKFRNGAGKILYVRYDPNGLLVRLRTLSAARPSAGPTMVHRLQATSGSCVLSLQMRIRGAASAPTDVEQPELRKVSGTCPGGLGTVTNAGFTVAFDGTLMTVSFPFAALGSSAPALASGVTLAAPRASTVGGLGVGVVDESQAGSSFQIGSDVPPDVDCTARPGEAVCQG